MKIPIVLVVLIVFGVLRLRRAPLLLWAFAWWAGVYVVIRFGFVAPIPSSVVMTYMSIVTGALLAYISSSQDRRAAIASPLVRLMTEKRYTPLLALTVVAIPALAAANVYVQMNAPLQPPFFARTVHPASPSEITVHDKKVDLDNGENPYRQLETSNPAEFRKHVEHGREVYSTAWIRFRPISPTRGRSRCCGRRSCSGGSRKAAPGCLTRAARGTPRCPRGKRC